MFAFLRVDKSKTIQHAAGTPRLRYIYRPVLLEGCFRESEQCDSCINLGTGSNLSIPGFGVEMAVKNMEYSALDEKKVLQSHLRPQRACTPCHRVCKDFDKSLI